MRLTTLVLLLIPAVLLAGGDDKKSGATQTQPAKTAAATSAPHTLPSDAKRTGPNTYSWTDAQGKKWIYRQTPFGLVRLEDKPETVESAPEPITAVEDGDVVHFERPSPFGKQKWTKRKADLTADEIAVLERQKQQSRDRKGTVAATTTEKDQ